MWSIPSSGSVSCSVQIKRYCLRRGVVSYPPHPTPPLSFLFVWFWGCVCVWFFFLFFFCLFFNSGCCKLKTKKLPHYHCTASLSRLISERLNPKEVLRKLVCMGYWVNLGGKLSGHWKNKTLIT